MQRTESGILPEVGAGERVVRADAIPDASYNTLFARRAEVLRVVLLHCRARLGLPAPSTTSFKADVPLSLVMNAHVDLSAGFTHTAGWVRVCPPCGTSMMAPTSPPVAPVPCPPRLSRSSSRNSASLPPITASLRTLLAAGVGKIAGKVLPRS